MSNITVMDINTLLGSTFKRDKTEVRCIANNTCSRFEERTKYKVYLSEKYPRIYETRTRSVNKYSFSTDIAEEILFEVNTNDLIFRPITLEAKMLDKNQMATSIANNIKEKELKTQNTRQRVINRLNGIQLAEESLVELRQDVSEKQDVNIDLVSLLSSCPQIKDLKLGQDAILEAIEIENAHVTLQVSKGKVSREENSAVVKALQSLVNKGNQQ